MAPPEPPPDPLWHFSLVCLLLVWHVPYIVSRHLKHTEPLGRYKDLGFSHVDPKSLSFHVDLSSRGSASLAVPPAIQWWLDHLHTGFHRGILYKTPGNCRGPTATLNTSLRLQSTCTLLLALSYMICMSCTSHSSTQNWRRAHKMTRLGTWSKVFPDRQRPCTVSCWRYTIFLVTGVHWMWSVVPHSGMKLGSQPTSLEHSWPGLAIWSLDNFLAQGRRPCPSRGRRWYSYPIQ